MPNSSTFHALREPTTHPAMTRAGSSSTLAGADGRAQSSSLIALPGRRGSAPPPDLSSSSARVLGQSRVPRRRSALASARRRYSTSSILPVARAARSSTSSRFGRLRRPCVGRWPQELSAGECKAGLASGQKIEHVRRVAKGAGRWCSDSRSRGSQPDAQADAARPPARPGVIGYQRGT